MIPLKPRFVISPLDSPQEFRSSLGEWFDKVGKDYPWRRTLDPYAVLVSEVMLQQTRIASVLGKGYFTRFLQTFPDLNSLAVADDTSLLKAWEGLGYYRRARMLRETAIAVLLKHNGIFPQNEHELLALPGIGHYTAAALMAFSFKKPSALVDGNVSRVLARLMDDAESINATHTIRKHRDWSSQLCDPILPDRHHHAMMELGQNICMPQRTTCFECPVAKFCKCSQPQTLPNRKPRANTSAVDEHGIWARDPTGRVLLNCENGSRRLGLWKIPLRPVHECSSLPTIYQANYSITRYKVSLHIYNAIGSRIILQQGDEWIDETRLQSLPLAAPFKKALGKLLAYY
jgi:A/G-specific adenine glycosylase